MTPLAHVHIPLWGDTRVPVLAIDGDVWTVQGPRTARYPDGRRVLGRAELNLLAMVPVRVPVRLRRGRGSRVVDAHGEGSEAMEDRRVRLIQASENGLRVDVFENI